MIAAYPPWLPNIKQVNPIMPFFSDYSGRSDRQTPAKPLHYYGDAVRALFVVGALLMLLTLPIFSAATPLPAPVSLIAIAVLGLAAGFTSPTQRWTAPVNLAIALTAVLGFGYHAVRSYAERTPADPYFWINQVLALVFLVALYYSAKTVRGMLGSGGGSGSLSDNSHG